MNEEIVPRIVEVRPKVAKLFEFIYDTFYSAKEFILTIDFLTIAVLALIIGFYYLIF